eukprot:Amastigsp_a845694_39.p2 type:complete len:140 gc:universal Amastigsp_a845694_39:233-652(+)
MREIACHRFSCRRFAREGTGGRKPRCSFVGAVKVRELADDLTIDTKYQAGGARAEELARWDPSVDVALRLSDDAVQKPHRRARRGCSNCVGEAHVWFRWGLNLGCIKDARERVQQNGLEGCARVFGRQHVRETNVDDGG